MGASSQRRSKWRVGEDVWLAFQSEMVSEPLRLGGLGTLVSVDICGAAPLQMVRCQPFD